MSDIPMDEKALETAAIEFAMCDDASWAELPLSVQKLTREDVRVAVTAYLAALPPVVTPSREAVEASIAHLELCAATEGVLRGIVPVTATETTISARAALLALIFPEPTP